MIFTLILHSQEVGSLPYCFHHVFCFKKVSSINIKYYLREAKASTASIKKRRFFSIISTLSLSVPSFFANLDGSRASIRYKESLNGTRLKKGRKCVHTRHPNQDQCTHDGDENSFLFFFDIPKHYRFVPHYLLL